MVMVLGMPVESMGTSPSLSPVKYTGCWINSYRHSLISVHLKTVTSLKPGSHFPAMISTMVRWLVGELHYACNGVAGVWTFPAHGRPNDSHSARVHTCQVHGSTAPQIHRREGKTRLYHTFFALLHFHSAPTRINLPSIYLILPRLSTMMLSHFFPPIATAWQWLPLKK